MSFLSNIYSKLGLSSSPPKRPQTVYTGATEQYAEEIDPELEGFVLLTENKRCKTVNHTESRGAIRIEEVGLQQADAGHVSQRPTHSPGISQYSVREDLVTRGRPSPQKEDFLTVSGVPVELSRKLQVLLALSSTKTEFRALNMKQYDYDFGLERNVLATMETYDGRP